MPGRLQHRRVWNLGVRMRIQPPFPLDNLLGLPALLGTLGSGLCAWAPFPVPENPWLNAPTTRCFDLPADWKSHLDPIEAHMTYRRGTMQITTS